MFPEEIVPFASAIVGTAAVIVWFPPAEIEPVRVPLANVKVGDAFTLNLFPAVAPEAIEDVIQRYPVEPLLIAVASELNVTVEPEATPTCVVPICVAELNVFDVAL